jgi:hypothetical protein
MSGYSNVVEASLLLFMLLNPFLLAVYLLDPFEKLSSREFGRVLVRAGVISTVVFILFAHVGSVVFTELLQARFASNIEKYCRDHFGDGFKVDKADLARNIRKNVTDEIKRKLGMLEPEEGKKQKPVKDPVLAKKDILYRDFSGKEDEPGLPPLRRGFYGDGKSAICEVCR